MPVYIVHCIDTEGPLFEPIEATFERLREIFGLQIEPTFENLRKLQNGSIDLGGAESAVQRVVDPQLVNYLDTWDKLAEMLDAVQSDDFRLCLPDSDGQGWIFNWFCVDHVGYRENPRRRAMGIHQIFDYYRHRVLQRTDCKDGVHFHFHPHAFSKKANHCATQWLGQNSPLYEIISRRLIDRDWFPTVNRPGFHSIRPDSHWFLEQFVPFDFSNQAVRVDKDDELQVDLGGGRFGDWRRAPATWSPYHPSYDDYQRPGDCRRWIARCLNVGTRLRLLTQGDVDQAFQEAAEGKPVILSFTDHDFRDMRHDVREVQRMIVEASKRHPKTKYFYSEARSAFREALKLSNPGDCWFDCKVKEKDGRRFLELSTDVKTFGPQPFLAIKTMDGNYYHDNFDIHHPHRCFGYVFDDQTIRWDAVSEIGIGSNNSYGTCTVVKYERKSDTWRQFVI